MAWNKKFHDFYFDDKVLRKGGFELKYYFVKIRLILKNIWGKGKEKFHGFFFKEKKIKNPMIFIVKGSLF